MAADIAPARRATSTAARQSPPRMTLPLHVVQRVRQHASRHCVCTSCSECTSTPVTEGRAPAPYTLSKPSRGTVEQNKKQEEQDTSACGIARHHVVQGALQHASRHCKSVGQPVVSGGTKGKCRLSHLTDLFFKVTPLRNMSILHLVTRCTTPL